MFSSTASSSSTSAFGSPLSFGQTSDSNVLSTIPFTSANGNSVGLFGSMQGTPSSTSLWGSSSGSTTCSQVPNTIASSSSGFSFNGITSFGQTTVPWVGSILSGSNTFFGTQSSLSGNQVGASIFRPSDQSNFGEKRGSRIISNTITSTVGDKGERNMFVVSISAMPCYHNKSHEELRWEDHHQFDAGGVGLVPASVQSNDFQNPKPHSVPSNSFSTTVTPSIGQYSFLNPAPPSVPFNPFAPPTVPPNPSAAQSFPASLNLLISPNSCNVPSASVTHPASISEPNKSPLISNLPTPTAPQCQQKLQCEEMEKSVQLICKDVLSHEEDMKRWIERYRCLELEKMEDTETIKQLREELADQVAKSKDAIIAEYLESPAFTKRLDEEHEKRLSEIFHPCYVNAVRSVQTKLPDSSSVQPKSAGSVQTKLPETDTRGMVYPENFPGATGGFNYHDYKKKQEQEKKPSII